ncbi:MULTISPECIES: TetR family transcriptional regulator C-terminal domain-containing protein [Streptomyces]|uniref:TetR family transcriptional regulator C-terminal domain-containing protein n=1 Tax=Streptomyces solicathayae TaxID=3081768 RepID=A0ABZ0M5Q0_9ACTN|nr:TetR family transcriptional regulator C-terminal domain-containing protein [Streptomyces sp. HUAS YS2]WOX26384.1 TetR family transcriptional regulator C-terminal domain-containing protein [Streptomyces sp. HUAS YS2]
MTTEGQVGEGTGTDARAVADRARLVVRSAAPSQREFAVRIGMDPTALSKALNGSRRLTDRELAAIARAGKVSLRYLRTGQGKSPAAPATPAATDVRRRADALDAEARRAQILEETARLIARRGFHRVRVADIARACGTSTGTIHYHFPTKGDALRAALHHYADRLHRRLEAEFQDADGPVEKLRRLIEVQLVSADDDHDEWSVWVQSWNEAILDPDLREGQRDSYARWRRTVLDLVHACQDEGLAADADPEALTSRFTALADGLAIQVLAGNGDMSVPRMRELLLDAFEPHLSLR